MTIKKLSTLALLVITTHLFSIHFSNNFYKQTKPTIRINKGFDYETLWKKVDSCENKGLSESALKIVSSIYTKAKTENNAGQFVKAILHRMKFESYKEEFSLEKSILKLQNEVKEAKNPIKPILHSILADAFWQYFQNNRWKFYNRTPLLQVKNEDITTWDLKTITKAVITNYKASISNPDILKQTKINLFDVVLNKGTAECRTWRPTLFDFLAHRALAFYMNSEIDVTRPANRFSINDKDYLKAYVDFTRLNITNPSDSLETKFEALRLMQSLTLFHEKDQNPEALIDIELLRLDFVYRYSKHEKKDSLYINTLSLLQTLFIKNERVTEIDTRIANWYIEKGNEYKPLQGASHKWDKKLAKTICESAIEKFPKSYGASECKNILQSIQSKKVNFIVEEVNEPNKPFRALVTSQNVSKLYFKIVKTSHQELTDVFGKKYGKELFEHFNKLPIAKMFSQDLLDDGDFQTHQTEIKLPELTTGYYVILSSLTEDFNYNNNLSSYNSCIISNIASMERRREDGSYDIYALHRQTGEALKQITAQLWHLTYNYNTREYEYTKGATYKTDEKGFFNISYKAIKDNHFFIEFIHQNDKYFNNNRYYTYQPNQQNTSQIRSFIYTDRAIYRPGQTVYFKSIVLESINGQNHQIKTQFPVSVSLYNVNGEKIHTLDLTTNEFGTISGSFIAPQTGLNGQMNISDNLGNSAAILVEDYKRPKFETYFNPLKGSYQLNDDVLISGSAKAYAGNVIDAANVKYRVVRSVSYPYWYRWYNPFQFQAAETEITNGEIVTNDSGNYIIKFKAIPDESVSKTNFATFNYHITADVTDINGETHSTETDIKIGYKALQLNIVSDEVIETSQTKPIQIHTTNLNDVAEACKGNYKIYKLKQPQNVFRNRLWTQPDRHTLSRDEYYKTFPNDLYADENNKYTWEKESVVFEQNFDTGIKNDYDLTTTFKNSQPGVYLIEANCKDKFGEEIKAFKYITIFNKDNQLIPEQTANWLYYPKKTAEPGEKVSYILASGYKNVNYLFEIEHQGKPTFSQVKVASMNTNDILVEESHRGNFAFHTSFIKYNRLYQQNQIITVPYTNKQLDIEFETFRNKLLPGQKEEWKLILKDKKGEKLAAELVASMYDASLDAFKKHDWDFNIYQNYYARLHWSSDIARIENSADFNDLKTIYSSLKSRNYDELNYFGLVFWSNQIFEGEFDMVEKRSEIMAIQAEGNMAPPPPPPVHDSSNFLKMKTNANKTEQKGEDSQSDKELQKTNLQTNNLSAIKTRSRFNETAFFYPQLQTNEKGEVVIQFTVPETLTKWKVLGLAHTKDLKYGQFEKEIITQKELMIQPNAPRFFREGDKITFISKIANLSNNDLSGMAELKLYDAITEQEISSKIIQPIGQHSISIGCKDFTVKKGLGTSVEWNLKIPEGYSAIKYKIVAKANQFSDGEEMVIPVLTNKMLVTESMPISIKTNETKTFQFEKFTNQNNYSNTLKNHAYTLEFTANPAWLAVQALPYLMEFPYECSEQLFARYYANSLATYIINSKPKIKTIFETWKNINSETFLSNLEKNQELKSILLEETPWVMDSKNENENKKRLSLLFDLNKMSIEQTQTFQKLSKKQTSNGGFSWFEGGPDDWFITQHIITGLARLKKLGAISENDELKIMLSKAVNYCDLRIEEEFKNIKKQFPKFKTEQHLSHLAIHYLYMRSHLKEVPINVNLKVCLDYYKKQEQTYWLKQNRYMQAMIAMSLHQFNDVKTPKNILKSLKENSIQDDEMGMYWKENYGFSWHEAPVEMQAMMIEAFYEINQDTKVVDNLKTWLIKNKQTQHWGTTKATTDAIYALLLRGNDWLTSEPKIELTVGNKTLDLKDNEFLKTESGIGYIKQTWHESSILPSSMGKITVSKRDTGISYGAVYWQYFEQMDKITSHQTPLKILKQLYVQKNTVNGPVLEQISDSTKLKIGDKLKVRIELRVDRPMDYIHLKDMRASGLEPTNIISHYNYQDGLGYYESTRDAASHFFFTQLLKGTYVFEYPLIVNHYGDFSTGITTIQCMYAPEYSSHSEGTRIKVIKEK